jgi:hypothetical protein
LIQHTRYWNHRSLTAWSEKIDAGELPVANTETLDLEKVSPQTISEGVDLSGHSASNGTIEAEKLITQ